jgi:hypothetical protein
MKSLLLFFILCMFFAAPTVCAQSASVEPLPPEEQNETMRDTLKRMQIKREENEHKKLLEKGAQIQIDAESLAKAAVNNSLPRSVDKKLRDIEKSARNIRSDFGGSGDDSALELPPENLTDAIKQLSETAELLNQQLSKTSRRVISVSVVETANEIAQLVKIIRGFVR